MSTENEQLFTAAPDGFQSKAGQVTVTLPPQMEPGESVTVENCGPGDIHVGAPPWPAVIAPGATETWTVTPVRRGDGGVTWKTERATPSHLWPCGCLINDAGAHRAGCPDHPEGVRG